MYAAVSLGAGGLCPGVPNEYCIRPPPSVLDRPTPWRCGFLDVFGTNLITRNAWRDVMMTLTARRDDKQPAQIREQTRQDREEKSNRKTVPPALTAGPSGHETAVLPPHHSHLPITAPGPVFILFAFKGEIRSRKAKAGSDRHDH
ncbi:hypothetical protein GWI33_013601 [Rhynchophorus ferrugineus]|uniref:Uncharacterized protein n=1 Tax=Rhynchophorus ferrugineus TaxID=354439 RepID=A0A834I989_RHYFE|nr:hypothetical protein GWI33_013601 [Rhynchophorus ferrugineus]